MKLNYAPQARADLAEIGEYSRLLFGPAVASSLETYMRATIARIAAMPESGHLFQSAKACEWFRSCAIPSEFSIPRREAQ
jgi:plasmid stabilization system protein ParE